MFFSFTKYKVVSLTSKSNNSAAANGYDREVLTPIKDVSSFEQAGHGRKICFHTPQNLGTLISRITAGLGNVPGLSVAVPQSVPAGSKFEIKISTVGICAGSGSMLNGLDVDLLFTGELSHHEALAAIEKGKCVITAFHSNTERQFLRDRMQKVLTQQIKKEISSADGIKESKFEVAVSETDRDPYEIVLAGQKHW